jgi:hypothetical protein
MTVTVQVSPVKLSGDYCRRARARVSHIDGFPTRFKLVSDPGPGHAARAEGGPGLENEAPSRGRRRPGAASCHPVARAVIPRLAAGNHHWHRDRD